jgi:hypothetical protein
VVFLSVGGPRGSHGIRTVVDGQGKRGKGLVFGASAGAGKCERKFGWSMGHGVYVF